MSDLQLFDLPPVIVETPVRLSPGARRTARQRTALEAGVHPAMGGPVRTDGEKCGTCVHLTHMTGGRRSYPKCPKTRLGLSHSEASDIRVSWPGCVKWELNEEAT